jgi:predicted DNA-binding transcriptional regulator YafY
LCLADIEERYGVGRRTAQRMRRVVAELFPEISREPGPDGRDYWKLRRGRANGLVVWSVDEIAALESAIRRARESGHDREERALRSVVEKLRSLIGHARAATGGEECPRAALAPGAPFLRACPPGARGR